VAYLKELISNSPAEKNRNKLLSGYLSVIGKTHQGEDCPFVLFVIYFS
jgi:hypothetical protein